MNALAVLEKMSIDARLKGCRMRQEFETIVVRLSAIDLCVADLCREAEIARSTWDRWVRGDTAPNWATWAKVREAVDKLETSAASRGTGVEAAE